MTQAPTPYLVKSREHRQEFEVPREGIFRIFSLVERGELLGTLEVYAGGVQVGMLRRGPQGLWEIGWRSESAEE